MKMPTGRDGGTLNRYSNLLEMMSWSWSSIHTHSFSIILCSFCIGLNAQVWQFVWVMSTQAAGMGAHRRNYINLC